MAAQFFALAGWSWRRAALLLTLTAGPALAEPYLAIREGMSCLNCHANPTGGGLRNPFGNIYAQQQLPAQPLSDGDVWTGEVLSRFGIGANGRVAARQFERDDRDDNLDFAVDRLTVYGSARLNEHVSLYVDQQLAPGGSANREAWVKIQWSDFYLRGGRFFLPFGWRLEDNSAFTRQVTGVSMEQGDDGLEFGYASQRIDVQLAITNGNGGGSEIDDGKLISGRAAWVSRYWQLGVSGFNNNTDGIDRSMFGLFGGFNTGPVAWLAEYDWIEDKDGTVGVADTKSSVGLIEANWLLTRGHNLKATFEIERFEDDLEDRLRGSLVYEFFPWPFTQLRAGFRIRDSDDPDPRFNNEEGFVQLHAYL